MVNKKSKFDRNQVRNSNISAKNFILKLKYKWFDYSYQ